MNQYEQDMLSIAKRAEKEERQKKIIAAVIFLPFLILGLIVFFSILSAA